MILLFICGFILVMLSLKSSLKEINQESKDKNPCPPHSWAWKDGVLGCRDCKFKYKKD